MPRYEGSMLNRDADARVLSQTIGTQGSGYRSIPIALGLVSLMTIVACGPSPGTAPASTASTTAGTAAAVGVASVSIQNFKYSPDPLTVPVGTTVTWKNLDDEAHTLRSADLLIRSNALDQDETYSVKFDKPGTYPYTCSLHPKMHGTIVVK